VDYSYQVPRAISAYKNWSGKVVPSRAGADTEALALAIGRTLMARPRLILMDEPSMGLSPLLVKEVFSIIARLNQELGVTILLAEQNARRALQIASYGYIMEQGKVVLDGNSHALFANEDVKEFYLGGSSQRKSFKDLKSFKRRKRWL
jgi:branched-chain amino acid transport system ATP-binding protein